VSPYAYRSGNSPLHRCPAPVKLAGILALSVFSFSSIPGLVIAALIITGAAIVAGGRPWELVRGSRPLLILIFFIIVMRTFVFDGSGPSLWGWALPGISVAGFWGGIRQGLAIMVSFAAGALLFTVTTMGELRRGLGKNRLSLGISLMLGFLPRFFEIWETANLACEARSCKKGFRRLIIILPLVIERMMQIAGETAEALEARGIIV
jgi:biotin transport system permease protein